mmetsp:Transcript_7315/g.10798  ORF Transcript_7315/g.10798 Transcript_7315/m.10798 type:complete len:622 (-) Transcript_7315:49-1914(-)
MATTSGYQSASSSLTDHENDFDSIASSNDANDDIEGENDGSVSSTFDHLLENVTPTTEPLVVIDLAKLCGYDLDPTEAEEVSSQLEEIFVASSEDFHAKSCELFEYQAAIHVDTESVQRLIPNDDAMSRFCVLKYPDVLGDNEQEVDKIWRKLNRRSNISPVQQLLDLIKNTSRDLIWKLQMNEEVNKVARDANLKEWKTVTRSDKLDKLYEIREVFAARLKDAEEHLVELKDARQIDVAQRLAAAGIDMSDLQEIDVDDNDDAGDSTMNRSEDSSYDSTNDFGDDSSKYLSSDDDGDDDDDDFFISGGNGGDDDYINNDLAAIPKQKQQQQQQPEQSPNNIVNNNINQFQSNIKQKENEAATAVLPPIDDEARAHARQAAREKRQAARRIKHAQRLRENAEASRLEAVRARAAKILEDCITTEEKVNEANVQSLMKQLDKVDELLESLQEEAWADEEEDEEEVNNLIDDNSKHQVIRSGFKAGQENKLTLLDQILAMVLFSLPNLHGLANDVFMAYKGKQHMQIVKEWKEHFGCLPPPIFTDSSDGDDGDNNVAALHAGAGNGSTTTGFDAHVPDIAVTDDWEDLADADDDSEKNRGATMLKPATETVERQVGLRPGGKI